MCGRQTVYPENTALAPEDAQIWDRTVNIHRSLTWEPLRDLEQERNAMREG